MMVKLWGNANVKKPAMACLLVCGLLYCLSVTAEMTLVYPQPESLQDNRAAYPIALLQLCQTKSAQPFTIRPSKFHSQQGRSLRLLAEGKGLDIVWAFTTPEREEELLPIRIPIDRGLIGWRLLLINKSEANRFDTVKSISDLALLKAGQGHDWPDTEILRNNQLSVRTSTTYEGLFNMLALGHIDYFPRSIAEIWPEVDSHSNLPIGVQPKLAIHYKAAFYYFVNKHNEQLAKTLEACLNKAINDGSMRLLFNQYFAEAIRKSKLTEKNVIELSNPTLPPKTPVSQAEYWFSPNEKPL